MPSCPAGHDSATLDYCDDCGTSIGGAAAAATSLATSSSAAPDPIDRCASCGGPRSGRFCEECGHDGMLPAPARAQPAVAVAVAAAAPDPSLPDSAHPPAPGPAARGWIATVRADHDWYEEMREGSGNDAVVLPYPRYCPERRFELAGAQLLIGRRNRARGVEPEIDLSGSPMDPGVSTLHAMLVSRDDGGWEVVDLGSTNGTTVGDGADPIPPNIPVPLADGDRIKIGAWTTITVSRAAVDR
jgi:hypothetical protein